MILTNKLNLPAPLVEAVARQEYSRGLADISISELISPPRQRALIQRNKERIEEDVADRIWSLVGQLGHSILQKTNTSNALTEERFFIQLDGWTLSGQLDHFSLNEKVLTDYKFTTVWRLKNDGVPEEWKEQLNCYAYLLRKNGHTVEHAQVLVIFRDWLVTEAAREPLSYPQKQAALYEVQMWPEEMQLYFLRQRLELHRQAQLATDELLPECTPAERWQRRTLWQCIRFGNKKATRVFTTEREANEFVFGQKVPSEFSIVRRLGEAIRCVHYCPASPFCTQYQQSHSTI